MPSTIETCQCNAFEHALAEFLQSKTGSIPVKVWGNNESALQTAPVAVYVHAEKETAPELGRQILKGAVTVRTAATVDTDRQDLDSTCSKIEGLIRTADLELGTGCAIICEGWGPVNLSADNFSVRSCTLRAFIHF